ncbi:MmgE/PrpD family protein [Hoeflea sp.]|uniref:MmgE/PrpD family protein n=1 Tax=Hoeflea sp. TaxID=1940281 RepID=UPI003A8FFB87
MSAINATKRLGDYLAGAVAEPLKGDVAEKAAICLLDATGLAVLAHAEPAARAARTIAATAAKGQNSARIWADGRRVSAGEAALVNGIATHAHFQDDTDHDSWSHPGSLVPPAVIAICEARGLDLGVALRAITAGYATMNWLGRGEEVSRKLIARGIRTSPTFGTIGAAAGCAVALGLDSDKASAAVAIAANTTGGTLEPVRCGSDEWRVQNGRAAQGGLVAGLLAEQGVAGAANALEGARGFLFALAGADAAPAAWQLAPDPSIMLGIMAKPFATLGDNMAAACAARVARRNGIPIDDISSISVTLWRPYTEYPGTSFRGPYVTNVQTQASTAYAVCAMLIHGNLTYEMGTSERNDPRLLDLISKTEIRPHDGSHHQSVVTVHFKDGQTVTGDAKDAPKTLILQDADRALEVFEERLTAAGHKPGDGCALGETVLSAAASGRFMPISEFFDRLPAQAPR